MLLCCYSYVSLYDIALPAQGILLIALRCCIARQQILMLLTLLPRCCCFSLLFRYFMPRLLIRHAAAYATFRCRCCRQPLLPLDAAPPRLSPSSMLRCYAAAAFAIITLPQRHTLCCFQIVILPMLSLPIRHVSLLLFHAAAVAATMLPPPIRLILPMPLPPRCC